MERQNFSKNFPIRVVVVGCGYSGIELAAVVSERLQDKGNVEAVNVGKTILPDASAGNRDAALKVSYFFLLVYKNQNKITKYVAYSHSGAFVGIAQFAPRPINS